MRPCTCDRVLGSSWSTDQCRLCWLYHHDERYRNLWDSEKTEGQPGPKGVQTKKRSLWRIAGQFVSYAEAIVRWKLAGSPVTPPEELAKREQACFSCEHHDHDKDGCKLCGCGVEGGSLAKKRGMATETCPDDPPRW